MVPRRGPALLGWFAAALLVAGAAFLLGAASGPLWMIRFAGFVVLAVFVATISVQLLGRGTAEPQGRQALR
jgi:multidrug efflux pump subunit AcrA (membrane-fusion protein)